MFLWLQRVQYVSGIMHTFYNSRKNPFYLNLYNKPQFDFYNLYVKIN